jgi:hypothetical protein
MAGLKCAPLRRQKGERMMRSVVKAMAIPIRNPFAVGESAKVFKADAPL